MDRKKLIQQVEQDREEKEEEDMVEGVPVCGANLVSPVTHTTNFIKEIRYKIGTRLYIENAD